jgi:hypothetical protein
LPVFEGAGQTRATPVTAARLAAPLVALIAGCAPEAGTYGPNAPTGYNVVFVTLDGVRGHALFLGEDPLLAAQPGPIFTAFPGASAGRGRFYGDPRDGSELNTTNAMNGSLPAFTAIYAEVDQGCLDNNCPRIAVPTFVDRLHDELALAREALVVQASWPRLDRAVSGRDDVAVVRAQGTFDGDPATHPEHGLLDPALDWDVGTVLEGFTALEARPRYLHLALLDSDRYGHRGDYARHVALLRAYDRLLAELLRRLDAAGEYGRKTALIVATDHGRGLWDQWKDHGPGIPSAAAVWAWVRLPPAASELELVPADARTFTQHDLRYTIEALFGLSTTSRAGHSTGFVVSAGGASP